MIQSCLVNLTLLQDELARFALYQHPDLSGAREVLVEELDADHREKNVVREAVGFVLPHHGIFSLVLPNLKHVLLCQEGHNRVRHGAIRAEFGHNVAENGLDSVCNLEIVARFVLDRERL